MDRDLANPRTIEMITQGPLSDSESLIHPGSFHSADGNKNYTNQNGTKVKQLTPKNERSPQVQDLFGRNVFGVFSNTSTTQVPNTTDPDAHCLI